MATPPSPPHVGMRRKGIKTLPKLPLSAFSHTGTSEQFPPAASPSAIHPEQVIDAHVVAPTGDLTQWKKEARDHLDKRIGGVVLSLTETADVEKTISG